jgi:AbrB family looped-hinge helix DNA binding protein
MISYTFHTKEEIMTEQRNAWTIKVGEKGQFVIPKEARDMFGIKPGDTLLVMADKDRGIAIPQKEMMQEYISSIFNSMK